MVEGNSSSASNAMSDSPSALIRNSGDIGWEFAQLIDKTNQDRIQCKLCSKVMSGGIYRIKQHISHIKGNVAPCPKSTDDQRERCKKAIEEAGLKKKKILLQEKEVREEVIIEEEGDDDILSGGRKRRLLGPMDRYAFVNDPDSLMDRSKKMRQQNISDTLFKERTKSVHQYLARWVYEAGIPFHAIDNDAFKRLVEAIGQFGPNYKPPSQYLLREPLLKNEVERTKGLLKKQEEE